MSARAWSALADRFTALAGEMDFPLWFYDCTKTHPPKGVSVAEVRYFGDTPEVPIRTGYPAFALQQPHPLTPTAFALANRFIWLSWAAGRLLLPGAARPDVEWFATVFSHPASAPEREELQGVLRTAVADSAAVARQFAERDPIKADVAPLPPAGSWELPFQTLRESFNVYAAGQPEFHLELRTFTTQDAYLEGGQRLEELFLSRATSGRPIETQGGTGPLIWGAQNALQAFKGFALQAGKGLPPFLRSPVRLYPLPAPVFREDFTPQPLLAWFEFLRVVTPENYQACIEPRDTGARKAV